MYHFSVPELALVGSEVGVVKATDADTGKNAEMSYRITDEQDTFQISTNPATQEGVLILKKVGNLAGSAGHWKQSRTMQQLLTFLELILI